MTNFFSQNELVRRRKRRRNVALEKEDSTKQFCDSVTSHWTMCESKLPGRTAGVCWNTESRIEKWEKDNHAQEAMMTIKSASHEMKNMMKKQSSCNICHSRFSDDQEHIRSRNCICEGSAIISWMATAARCPQQQQDNEVKSILQHPQSHDLDSVSTSPCA